MGEISSSRNNWPETLTVTVTIIFFSLQRWRKNVDFDSNLQLHI
jgi:hypothetical protein